MSIYLSPIFAETSRKDQPYGSTTGQVGITKFMKIHLLGTKNICKFIVIHPTDAEIFMLNSRDHKIKRESMTERIQAETDERSMRS